MILGADRAPVSSEAPGCTVESTPYRTQIKGLSFILYDTAGLNEITTIRHQDAVTNLRRLLESLTDGVSLLVYVIRGPRIKEYTVENYKRFFDICRQKKVPVVLVVTGLEHEEVMDQWWDRNWRVFDRHGMRFSGQACITATKGKWARGRGYTFAEEYEESVEKVRQLVWESCP